jgi:hypothetical protein
MGPESQILSPRPIVSNYIRRGRKPEDRPTWFWPWCSSTHTRINTELHAPGRCKTVYKIEHIPVMERPGARLKLQAADSERVVTVANVRPNFRCLIQRAHNFRVADDKGRRIPRC